MSDERLRALERRFKETGAAEDEAAWLVECVRAGQRLDWDAYGRLATAAPGQAADYLERLAAGGPLSDRDLRVLAYLGHPPARALRPDDATELTDSRLWYGGLFQLSPRAAAAVAALALGSVVAALEEPLDEAVSGALEEARRAAFDLYRRAGTWAAANAAHDRCSEVLHRSGDPVTNAFAWAAVHVSLVATILTEREDDADASRDDYLQTEGLRLQDRTRARSAATSTFLASASACFDEGAAGTAPLALGLLGLLDPPD